MRSHVPVAWANPPAVQVLELRHFSKSLALSESQVTLRRIFQPGARRPITPLLSNASVSPARAMTGGALPGVRMKG
jgi:hypothetical protein